MLTSSAAFKLRTFKEFLKVSIIIIIRKNKKKKSLKKKYSKKIFKMYSTYFLFPT